MLLDEQPIRVLRDRPFPVERPGGGAGATLKRRRRSCRKAWRQSAKATGNDRSRIRFLITLGDIEQQKSASTKRRRILKRRWASTLDNTMTHAIVLVSLARVAFATGNFERAESLCRDSIALFDEVRHLWESLRASTPGAGGARTGALRRRKPAFPRGDSDR